jgi:serine/threonine protein kinase
MALASGSKLGPYEIQSPLGAGGMGEVYRARDTRLGRDVAIKVLPVTFARDNERMSRFQREAQVLASLNHPNIAVIYGLEDSGSQALIMELLEGPTLAERIARGPFPKEEALSLAGQIAQALEYAHERGVIHRDLKPANIKLTADGNVKILDFGLAKVLMGDSSPIDSSSSPTFTSLATQAGVIIGTAAYMSPEQAKGKSVDRRTDIWAFGCVLYEMLSGKRAFHGETATDTLAAVIRAEPDWTKLPADTPVEIRRFLERCLRKDPKARLQAIGDARITLDELQNPAELESSSIPETPSRMRFRQWAVFAGVVLLAAAASGLIGWQLRGTPERPLVKFNIPMQDQDWLYARPRISPDGKKIVYRADNQLWIRELSQLSPHVIPDTTGAMVPFWSPNSSEVAFFKNQRLWKVPISEGGATAITAFDGSLSGGCGADWGPNDEIIFTTGQDAVYGVSARGGSPRVVVGPDRHTELDLHDPHFLPDGRSILMVPHVFAGGPDSIEVFTAGARRRLLRVEGTRLMEPVYSATGHIFFRREGDRPGLWAVPFSLSKLQVTGDPFLIAPDAGTPTLASNQTLAFVDHVEISRFQLAWIDTSGKTLEAVGSPELIFYDPQISPDGRLIAVATRRTGKLGIWILDILRGTLSPISSGSGAMRFPAWSPDAKSLIYVSTGAVKIGEQQLVRARADSSGKEEVLGEGTDPAYSPDGKSLFYAVGDKTKGFQLRLMQLEGDHTSRTLYYSNAQLSNPVPCPDGSYFAFVSAESGREEVYVKSISDNAGKMQVSNNGGTAPHWSKAGDRLFYVDGAVLVEVGLRTHPVLTLAAPRKLFTVSSDFKGDYGYDLTADGRRFLFVRRADTNQSAPVNLTVVQNWFGEFKDRQKQ